MLNSRKHGEEVDVDKKLNKYQTKLSFGHPLQTHKLVVNFISLIGPTDFYFALDPQNTSI